MSRHRRILAIFRPEEILPLLAEAADSPFNRPARVLLPSGHEVGFSRTLRCLAVHGAVCAVCGCACSRFELETSSGGVSLRAMIDAPRPKARGQKRNAAGWPARLTSDHRVPKSLGGADILANLRTACEICNSRKGCKPDEDWGGGEAGSMDVVERVRLASIKDAVVLRHGPDDSRVGLFLADYVETMERQRLAGDLALGYPTRAEAEEYAERVRAEFGLDADPCGAAASLCPPIRSSEGSGAKAAG